MGIEGTKRKGWEGGDYHHGQLILGEPASLNKKLGASPLNSLNLIQAQLGINFFGIFGEQKKSWQFRQGVVLRRFGRWCRDWGTCLNMQNLVRGRVRPFLAVSNMRMYLLPHTHTHFFLFSCPCGYLCLYKSILRIYLSI
jgi:hypothetical protein